MSDTINPIPGKHYRTRDGSHYRCYAVDGGHFNFPVHGASLHDGIWMLREHSTDGRFFGDHEEHYYDLVAERGEDEWTTPDGGAIYFPQAPIAHRPADWRKSLVQRPE